VALKHRIYKPSIPSVHRRLNKMSEFRKGGFNRGPREMHKATCSECKKECEVPFKPSGDRPVYCKECFQKRKKF